MLIRMSEKAMSYLTELMIEVLEDKHQRTGIWYHYPNLRKRNSREFQNYNIVQDPK